MHEAEYNLKLLERLPRPIITPPASVPDDLPRSWIHYGNNADQEVQNWMSQAKLEQKKYVCVHPGSSGSSRYLKTEVLCELIRTLKNKGVPVVLTGATAEAELLSKISTACGVPDHQVFLGKPLSQLAELYRNSMGVIAHGTGPLHLAAAVDTNVFAIFPPIFVLSEKRWGPLTSKRYTWTPRVACPAFYQCHGEKCAYFDCMDRFMIDDSVQRILHWDNEKAHF